MTFSGLAESCRMQKSFLSMVINQEMHINEEQAFLMAETFNLTSEETDYFLLLLQYARASSNNYAAFLKGKIEKIREKKGRLTEKLSKKTVNLTQNNHSAYYEYYLNPLAQYVHMLLLIPKYQSDLVMIAKRLDSTLEEIQTVIDTLQELDIVIYQNDRYECTAKSIHIENGTALSDQNHLNARLQALQKKINLKENDYRFSATICADTKVKKKIVDEIKNMLSRCQSFTQDTLPTDIYQFNIDFFQK